MYSLFILAFSITSSATPCEISALDQFYRGERLFGEKDSYKFSIDQKTRNDLDFERIVKPNLVEMAVTPWGKARLDYMLGNPLLSTEQIKKRQDIILELSKRPELIAQIREKLSLMTQVSSKINFYGAVHKTHPLFKAIDFLPFIPIALTFIDPAAAVFIFLFQSSMSSSNLTPEISTIKEAGNETKRLFNQFNSDLKDLEIFREIKKSFDEDIYFEKELIRYKSEFFRLLDISGITVSRQILAKDFQKNFNKTMQSLSAIAELDVYVSMADLYIKNRDNLIFPNVVESKVPKLSIKNGHHPYLLFTPEMFSRENSIDLSLELTNQANLKIITGPNTGGKSTYLRMIGLLSLMAQSGFPVPAEAMSISPMRLVSNFKEGDKTEEGKSTFESQADRISEVLHHINSTGGHKLVLMDEILTGTSGLEQRAAEVATIETLANREDTIAITITHDRKLAELAQFYPQIINFQVLLGSHDIAPGRSTTHNAIEVLDARGVDKDLINRAQQLLNFYQQEESKNSYPIIPSDQ